MQTRLLTKALKTPGFVLTLLSSVDIDPFTSLPIYFFTTSRGDIIVLTLCNHLTWLQQTKGQFREKFNTMITRLGLYFSVPDVLTSVGLCLLLLYIASLSLASVWKAVNVLQSCYEIVFVNNGSLYRYTQSHRSAEWSDVNTCAFDSFFSRHDAPLWVFFATLGPLKFHW